MLAVFVTVNQLRNVTKPLRTGEYDDDEDESAKT